MVGAPGAAPVLVFDLDGTILSVNSFPAWILFLVGGPLRRVGLPDRARLSLRVLRLLVGRKLGRAAHEDLLRGAQAAWAALAESDPDQTRLETSLLRRVRPALRPVLDRITVDGADAVLATAAAAEYTLPLGRRLGFATCSQPHPAVRRDALCNTGTRKRDRVMGFLRERGWDDRPLVFFTDHTDDLPLIRESSAVCWFGSASMLTLARQAAPKFRPLPAATSVPTKSPPCWRPWHRSSAETTCSATTVAGKA